MDRANELGIKTRQFFISKTEKMAENWHMFFNTPEELRGGTITWNEEPMTILKFEDMYIGQCAKENVKPDREILEHFSKVAEWKEYTPQFHKTDSIQKI